MQARGSTIRRARIGAGHGLNRFARQVQISPAHLSRIERNQRGAQPEVLIRIADTLGLAFTDVAVVETEETQ